MLTLEANRASFLLIASSALLVAAFTDSIPRAEKPTTRKSLHERYHDDDYEDLDALNPRQHYLGPYPVKKIEHRMVDNQRMGPVQLGPIGYSHQHNLLPRY